jgi:hypothetical protein
VDFVWLDIACIDQTPGSKESAAEIGRQAKIFQNAFCTFAWLTSHAEPCDEEYVEATYRLEQSVSEIMSEEPYSSRSVERDFANFLNFLTDDPWFTSLWTLQEAFLCPEVIFLARNGQVWLKGNPGEAIPRLKEILMWIEFLTSIMQDSRRNFNLHSSPEIQSALERSGLIGLLMGSPMVLLSVAYHRQTTSELDRVYGIMQVFNLRLGISRPEADTAKRFTLAELEDELGQQLFKQDPVMSQLHIFTQTPDRGKGWRVGRYSKMASDLSWDVYDHLKSSSHRMIASAQFSTTLVDDNLWGTFTGKTCLLHEFQATWTAYDKLIDPRRVPVEIALDIPPPRRPVDERKYHLETLQSLLREHHSAVVLLLGCCESTRDLGRRRADWTLCHAVGLILIPYEDSEVRNAKYWQRRGVVSWKLGESRYTAETRAFLQGETDSWTVTSGVFG